MSTTFNSIFAEVAFALNIGRTPDRALAEGVYSRLAIGVILPTDLISPDWVREQIQQAIIDVEYEVLSAICFNEKHPERGRFVVSSSPLASGSPLPFLSAGGTPFQGPFSSAVDVATGFIMTARPQQIVQWAIQNANSSYSTPARPLVWCSSGGQFLHNAPGSATLVGAAVARATFFVGGANIRPQDEHKTPIVAGTIARLAGKEGAWADVVKIYGSQYDAHLATIRAVPNTIAMPDPSKV